MQKAEQDSLFNFTKKNRLLSQQDFQSVFVSTNKTGHKSFLALYCPNHCSYARLGIIVSKKRIARAVDRNCIKRIVRESFRCHKDQLKGLDIIVLMRSEPPRLCMKLDKKSLRNNMDHLWDSLNKACKKS